MTTERVAAASQIDVQTVIDAIAGAFSRDPHPSPIPGGEGTVVRVEPGLPPTVYVVPERIADVCRVLKETKALDFNYLIEVTAVDYLDRFEVVYHLYSLSKGHALTLKAELDRAQASLPSVTPIWRGADLQEREVYDLMGITFTGHPNLKRILLYDEFVGHPLRKDFALPKE